MVADLLTSPEVLAALGAGALVVSAAAYSYLTGNEASVDLDDDGTDEVTFEGDEPAPSTASFEEPSVAEDVEKQADPTPDAVSDKEDLTDITGIGDTRASDLMAAGFTTPEDVYYASDENLTDVDGIGSYTVEQIRGDIGSIEGNTDGESTETSQDTEDTNSDTASEDSQDSS